MKKHDLTGRKFGLLTVVRRHEKNDKNNCALWECLCECGKEVIKKTGHINNGKKVSCGNHRGTHGMTGTPEYNVWVMLRRRCEKESGKDYENYGSRGIKFCKRWHSFENFFEDMGKRPSSSHSIERLNNDEGYSPENCIWADRTTQVRNRRVNKTNSSGVPGVFWITRDKKWAAVIGLNYKKIHLGQFANIEDAKKARKDAELKYWSK